MKSNYPLVTVFTLIYNTNPKYVIEAIESVRANNYPNLQHIIIDDCSPDPDPKSVVKEWIKNEGYLCEFYEHEVNFGVCKTLNHVLSLTKGDFLLGCSDDILLPNRIYRDIEILQQNNSDLVCSGINQINEFGALQNQISIPILKNKEGLLKKLIYRNFINAPAVTFKTQALLDVGGFDEKYIFEDFEMWLRFASLGKKFSFRQEVTTLYRVQKHSFSNSNELLILKTDLILKIKYSRTNKSLKDSIRKYLIEEVLHNNRYSNDLIVIYRSHIGFSPLAIFLGLKISSKLKSKALKIIRMI